jgi:hypothetical protein
LQYIRILGIHNFVVLEEKLVEGVSNKAITNRIFVKRQRLDRFFLVNIVKIFSGFLARSWLIET